MMNNGWQVQNRHVRMFQAISNVLFPLRWVIRNEAEFHAMLHGLFYICNNPARVIIEFQVGGGGKADLVLLRSVDNRDGGHPIVIELKFADNARELRQRIREVIGQLEGRVHCRGYERVTDGDTVVLSDATFYNDAEGPNTLISNCDAFHVKRDLGQGLG